MEWVVLLLALALVVGLAVVRARRPARPDRAQPPQPARPRRPRGDEPALTPDDEEDLARGFAAAEHDGSHILEALLDRRLRTVQSRRVPLRAVRPAPGVHTGRLVFANGMVLLARARRPSELYLVALNVRAHAICLDSWSHEPDGTVLRLTWNSETAELLALGLDQAD
ncbi:hypothetical protein [Ornithinimicrobium cryptoxanthini]|uniref:hypothetical protein n=1 Tax=Ornithinimicrobium cryptoxanthini TaxID=2934161 RepID=UPI0021174C89|nr:hypothetical protein [Ornithinimicrobium cryptoxanthini]